MSLKSIRESYSKLLATFNNAGIKLNENQKTDLDGFILALESTMSKQREVAIRKTKKVVTEKLEKEFKTVFESVMKNIQENNVLAAKIQDLHTKIVESKKLAHQVDDYLELYVESVLPKKTIVDYDRMQKLEKIHESLKDMLVVNEDAVVEKQKELDESFRTAKSNCETEVAKMKVKLNESMKKSLQLQKKIDSLKAIEILESKTKDLPPFEARAVKKQLAESSASDIEKNFSKVLESVKAKAKKIAEAEEKKTETTVEAEIDKIVNDDEIEEDDMLKNRNHNLHVSEDEEMDEDDMLKKTPHNGDAQHNAHISEEEVEENDVLKNRAHNAHVSEDEIEDFETAEEVKEDEDGNIELDESDIIDSDLMKFWASRSIELT